MIDSGPPPPGTVAADADRPAIRLPLAGLVTILGIVVFGTDILEVTLRPGPLEPLVGGTYLALYIAGLALAVASRALPRALVANPLLAALLALTWLSSLWSVDPATTLERAMMLTGTTFFALYLGWHYPLERLLQLLAAGVGLNVAVSAFLILAVPAIGIDHSAAWAGAWIGAFMHKNGMGAAMGMALVILLLAALESSGRQRALYFLAGLAAGLLLIGSQSATGLVVALITLTLAALALGWRRSRRGMLATALAGLVFLPILGYLATQTTLSTLALGLLEKDATAHGRTEIWQLVWPYITDRFWIGYGYASFWQPSFPWASQIEARLHYLPHYSHNGLVELWIAGGALAVGLFAAFFFLALCRSLILALAPVGMRKGSTRAAALPFLVLTGFALRNVTEASILQANDFLWLLVVAMTTASTKAVSFRLRPADVDARAGDAPGVEATPLLVVR